MTLNFKYVIAVQMEMMILDKKISYSEGGLPLDLVRLLNLRIPYLRYLTYSFTYLMYLLQYFFLNNSKDLLGPLNFLYSSIVMLSKFLVVNGGTGAPRSVMRQKFMSLKDVARIGTQCNACRYLCGVTRHTVMLLPASEPRISGAAVQQSTPISLLPQERRG